MWILKWADTVLGTHRSHTVVSSEYKTILQLIFLLEKSNINLIHVYTDSGVEWNYNLDQSF
jgi:hypothetical protein